MAQFVGVKRTSPKRTITPLIRGRAVVAAEGQYYPRAAAELLLAFARELMEEEISPATSVESLKTMLLFAVLAWNRAFEPDATRDEILDMADTSVGLGWRESIAQLMRRRRTVFREERQELGGLRLEDRGALGLYLFVEGSRDVPAETVAHPHPRASERA